MKRWPIPKQMYRYSLNTFQNPSYSTNKKPFNITNEEKEDLVKLRKKLETDVFSIVRKKRVEQEKQTKKILRQNILKATQGDVDAMIHVFHSYQQGDGTKANPESAMRWLEKAMETGDAAAKIAMGVQKLLGYNYKGEWYIEQNVEEGMKLLLQHVDQHPEGNFYLGEAFQIGYPGVVDVDYHKAFLHFQKSAHHGYGPSCYRLMEAFEDGIGVAKDEQAAVKALDRGCKTNDVHCLVYFAKCLIHGHFNFKADPEMGMEQLDRIGDVKQSAIPLIEMGDYYLYGYWQGITPDVSKAVMSYQKALNFPRSQRAASKMACMYLQNMAKDMKESARMVKVLEYLLVASTGKHADIIGYQMFQSMFSNLTEAYFNNSGNENAKDLRQEIKQRLENVKYPEFTTITHLEQAGYRSYPNPLMQIHEWNNLGHIRVKNPSTGLQDKMVASVEVPRIDGRKDVASSLKTYFSCRMDDFQNLVDSFEEKE